MHRVNHMTALVLGVIVLDFGVSIAQVSNQSLILGLSESARGRVNTIYMKELIAHGLPEEKIRLYPRGVDASRYTPAWRNSGRESAQGTRFLYVGRLSREKSVNRLVDAFRMVLEHIPGAQLTIVGDGPQAGELQAQAADMRGARPIWLPRRPNRVPFCCSTPIWCPRDRRNCCARLWRNCAAEATISFL